MAEFWRITRNRRGRAVYEALKRVGVTATWMSEYVRPLGDGDRSDGGPAATDRTTGDDGPVSVNVDCDPSAVESLDAPTEELVDGETVVGATADGDAVGYLFLSVDATHEIRPLERRLAIDGAYVRRVYVARDSRGRGVASAMLTAACRRAAARGAPRVTALVARDNRPSRALFESRGFSAVRDRLYARVGPFTYRSVRER